MKCPECQTPTDVRETRQGFDGTRRRRECMNEHRFNTVEIESGELERLRKLALLNTALLEKVEEALQDT